MIREELACRQVVELLTEYLEQSMPPAERVVLEQHLVTCGPCTTYLDQLRTTIALAGGLRREDVPEPVMDRLVRLFEQRPDP
jgi:anti-sigma factor RsiW